MMSRSEEYTNMGSIYPIFAMDYVRDTEALYSSSISFA